MISGSEPSVFNTYNMSTWMRGILSRNQLKKLKTNNKRNKHKKIKSSLSDDDKFLNDESELNELNNIMNDSDTLPKFVVRSYFEPRESLLTFSQEKVSFHGIANLTILLLIASNFRALLLCIFRFKIFFRDDIFTELLDNYVHSSIIFLVPFVLICTEITLYIEQQLSLKNITEVRGGYLKLMTYLTILLIPVLVINSSKISPVIGSIILLSVVSLLMKLYSYSDINFKLRSNLISFKYHNYSKNYNDLVFYPLNLTRKDIYYFLVAPTLCYELNFPRTEKIRVSFVLFRILEIMILGPLMFVLISQIIFPLLSIDNEEFGPIRPLPIDSYVFFEKLIFLIVPNMVFWLIMFYFYFHSCLNLLAELTYFADRSFYRDWWNACNISFFWKNWNIPVYRWCHRHIYLYMLSKKYSSFSSMMMVFFLSALFHEYVVSIPLGLTKYWAFMGMLFQIPMFYITNKIRGNLMKNMFFWVSIMIGQPFIILMYYYDYFGSEDVITFFRYFKL